MLRVYLDGEKRHTSCKKFSGGELHPNVSHLPREVDSVGVVAFLRSSDDVMEMLLTCEALSSWCLRAKRKTLYIPYMPYARQDRRCAEGDAFSLHVFSKSILSYISRLGFGIQSEEMHSEAGVGVIKNSVPSFINGENSLIYVCDRFPEICEKDFVAPDAGATSRVCRLANEFGVDFIQGGKIRNPNTGQLSGFSVDCDNLEGRDVIIIDDICDGGGTFVGLAQKLKEKNCGTISLCVVHGIFSRGIDVFAGIIDTVYTSNTFYEGHDHTTDGGVEVKVFNIY